MRIIQLYPVILATCVDCGSWTVLESYLTGALLCQGCGHKEEVASKAGEP